LHRHKIASRSYPERKRQAFPFSTKLQRRKTSAMLNNLPSIKTALSAIQLPAGNRTVQLVCASFSFVLFYFLILHFRILRPDLMAHIQISEDMMRFGEIPGHPLFFILLQALSFFSGKTEVQLFAAWLIFSSATWLKMHYSVKITEYFTQKPISWMFLMVLLMLQLAVPIPKNGFFIISQLSFNYFHNGTLTLALPLALMMFLEVLRFDEDGKPTRLYRLFFLGFVSVLIKPSFLFCLIPCFPLFTLHRHGMGMRLLKALQISTLLSFLLILQSLYFQHFPPSYLKEFHLVFKPFYLFGSIGNHFRMILHGFGIGIVLFALQGTSLWKDPRITFLLGMVLLGYFLSFFFYDVSGGIPFPDMTWQTVMVNYLAVLVLSTMVLHRNLFSWQGMLVLLMIFAHFLAGLRYLYDASFIRSFFI
jgi:hypothetical protein